MTQLDPAVVARVDQDRAYLAQLVAARRRHTTHGCEHPDTCPSRDVLDQLNTTSCEQVARLLVAAINDLARLDTYRPDLAPEGGTTP